MEEKETVSLTVLTIILLYLYPRLISLLDYKLLEGKGCVFFFFFFKGLIMELFQGTPCSVLGTKHA